MFQESNKTSTFKNLFAGLADSACREILSTAHPREFLRKDFIFSAGSPVKEVFLLTSGCVRVIQVTENGEEVTLRLNTPGELVNALGMVSQGTHNTTAQAIQESQTLVWKTSTFEAALDRFPILERNAQHMVERRICELGRRVCEISTAKAAPRLALELVRLLKQIGRKSNGQIEIAVPHEWLAEMTAMTECNVSRILRKWQAQGVVTVRRGIVDVRSYEDLKRLCQEPRI